MVGLADDMSRQPLPDTRASVTRAFEWPRLETHTCDACGVTVETSRPLKLYATVGMYDDQRPGELWLTAERPGRLVRGLLEMLSITVGWGLQHGAPVGELIAKWRGLQFEPRQLGGGSVADTLARWLGERFGNE